MSNNAIIIQFLVSFALLRFHVYEMVFFQRNCVISKWIFWFGSFDVSFSSRCSVTHTHTHIHKQEVQILKALVLGEEERGQSQYQVMCFVTKFIKSEFISTDAMAKLRQVSIYEEFSIISMFPVFFMFRV